MVTYVLKNNRAGVCRFGVTTGKKIGNAVTRNRCRRVIVAAFNSISEDICAGCDIVFVARFKTANLKSTDVCEIMKRQLKSAGVLK